MKGPWIGRLLRNVHAGEAKLLSADPPIAALPRTIALTSTVFADGGTIPRAHAGPGVGGNLSPPLQISAVPNGAVELVLTCEDPDAPLPRPFVHLLAYGLAPGASVLGPGALNNGAGGVIFGQNTGGKAGYAGPRAIPGHGAHRYYFDVYALSRASGLVGGAKLAEVRAVIAAHGLARGQLMGIFERT